MYALLIWKAFTFLDDPHFSGSVFIKDTGFEFVLIFIFVSLLCSLWLTERLHFKCLLSLRVVFSFIYFHSACWRFLLIVREPCHASMSLLEAL